MLVGVAALLALALACGRDQAHSSSILERTIDAELGKRLGVGVSTRCFGLLPACVTLLPDGGALPIVLERIGTSWEWHVDGVVITTDALDRYLREEVADLGAPQDVRCAPRIRRIVPGERIECWLEHGGKAFVVVRLDGSTSVEIVLDAAAAAARSEPVTPANDDALSRTSRSLEDAEEDGEDDDQPPADAGDPR